MDELTAGDKLALAAEAQLGTRFVLFGRDAKQGLDCVGLVNECIKQAGRETHPPEGYNLRNSDAQRWLVNAQHSGLKRAVGLVERGDVLLLKAGPAQQHLVIATSKHDCIHAHAGLRRVVRQPLDQNQDIIAHWRLANPED